MEEKGQENETTSCRHNHGDRLKNVEIERKFIVSVDTERKILQAGGKRTSDGTFTDTYFDSETLSLTLKDHWLRRRNGVWELKAPQPESGKENIGTCTKYVEVTSEPEIISLLSAILSPKTDIEKSNFNAAGSHSSFTLGEWTGEQKLTAFAKFTTHRKSYSMNTDRGITVVLDEMDFGFSVGEIEMMVEGSKENVAMAVATIDWMAKELGVRTETTVPGKMSAFLKKFEPRHYEALLTAGVLQK